MATCYQRMLNLPSLDFETTMRIITSFIEEWCMIQQNKCKKEKRKISILT